MTGKRLRMVLFVILAVIQLAVAAGAIIRSEIALRSGEVFRFRLQPVDPVDAFRGRYVALRFVVERAAVSDGTPILRNQKVWVPLVVDDEGFVSFGPVELEKPDDGAALRLRAGVDFTDEDGDRMVSLALPFQRYYLTEELAKAVDRSLWRRGRRPAWVEVRVRNGTGVVEDLYVDGRPVREWLAAGGPEQPPAMTTTTEP
jgi:uncharacterized membrane-anchored protein